jgi:hypothetical protein
MKTELERALNQCLARLEAGVDIDSCLRDQGVLASELRPLLEAAQSLREERQRLDAPSAAAVQAGRSRMHAARAAEAERAAALPWYHSLTRPLGLGAVFAALAVLAAGGLASGLFDFGATSTSAHVEGVVSRVDPDSILLTTDDGQVVVIFGDRTVLLDASGQAISGGDIVPGALARVEADEEDGEYHANNIEFEDDDERGHGAEVEFSGVVTSVSGSDVQVQASFGTVTVRIDAGTAMKDALAAGARVEVQATRQADGSFLAREIEDGGDDDGEGSDDGSNSGRTSGGSSSPTGEASENSGPGSTSDDSGSDDGGGDDDKPEDEEEDD